MKSQRFNVPPTKSKAVEEAINDLIVTFDEKTGNIIYKDNVVNWTLDGNGHHKTIGDEVSMTGNGLLTRGLRNEASGLRCYMPNEFPVHLLEPNNVETESSIRLLLGLQGKKNLVLTDNGRFYIVEGPITAISYDREIDPIRLNRAIGFIENFQNTLGNIKKLQTCQPDLVGAMNEIISRVNCPRRMVGKAQFLFFTDKDAKKFPAKDLDLAFNYERQRWLYYSAALEDWTYLPKGWQKITTYVRYTSELTKQPSDELEVGETIGVLDTEKCYTWSGTEWTEIAQPTNMMGDEYLVQFANINGSLRSVTIVYTGTGWVYTL